jgi:hypothetical protein
LGERFDNVMKTKLVLILLCFTCPLFAQRPVAKAPVKKMPVAVPAASTPALVKTDEKGLVSGRTYTNSVFGFQITFPDTWLIPGNDFEDHMKSQGYDISLRTPANVTGASKIQLDRSLQKVKVLVTAYRSLPGSADNAIMRVAVEDLTMTPQVKDAVDYFDLMRSQFTVMKLPADFKYSETQAEKLGAKQFAYLDTSSNAGKKRMYATVRNGNAIIFTLSYTKAEDLATMRQILAGGDFRIQNK